MTTKKPAKKPASATASPKNPYKELPERVTLDTVAAALPDAPAATQKLILRSLDVQAAVAWGVRADSQDILDDVPGYVGQCVNILHGLGARFTAGRLPPAIFGTVVAETRALAEAKRAYDAKIGSASGANTAKKSDVRAAIKQGVAQRDGVVTALRNALGDVALEKLEIGTAETPANLAKGLTAVATFLDAELARADDDTEAALALWGLDADTATALAATATSLTAFDDASVGTRRVEQRKLDEQDGRVLYLLDMIDRAFKQAHRADASILVPTFRKLSGLFGSRRAAAAPAPQPPPPAPDPNAPPTA
ncbi:MAG TPA: hypothetical protein VHB21_12370 [Minicystis sp.]|nr:hypothetical protein [Minicystis sp.]